MKASDRTKLRRAVLEERNLLSPGELQRRSTLITAGLLGMQELDRAATVLVYMHFRSEVRTLELIRLLLARGKTVSIPCVVPGVSRLLAVRITDPVNQVRPGYSGIPEPLPELLSHGICDPADLEVVIVPGSVFDRRGGRLGYGGGFYDRFLTVDAPGALRISPAYELQLVARVPMEPHDQFMDFVVTERRIYACGRNRYGRNTRLQG
ncbi:MAG: 5-formyltetrahydrofolate cyclo-ligase [Desulfobulbaceae bacterium]|jgi:5-formyltetrahydrofolate cyclo-ligase|nr:5-formyltetrahydrofolate cyclo-ligase [Desulfobulbaceae bacterium]MDY0349959.1 5-formyltetrahydrofolate cyclo-ligase [Desulfobulbaceae bacterium]